MIDIAWSEILIVIIVAVLVLKPQDLPVIIKWCSELARKISGIKKEVSEAVSEFSKETGLTELKNSQNFVIDLDGKRQPTYDLSEIKAALKPHDTSGT